MPVMTLCGTCDGRRYIDYEKCPECKGMGNIPDRSGTENLTAVLGAAGVELLSEHLDELMAWLREIDVLRSTRYALVAKRDHDGWGHAGPTEWVPAPACDGTPADRRLWTVKP